MFSNLTPAAIFAALAANPGHVFFDENLQRVEPAEGQWFCEFHVAEYTPDWPVRDGAMVEYLGSGPVFTMVDGEFVTQQQHLVADDGEDGARAPQGDVLILQV